MDQLLPVSENMRHPRQEYRRGMQQDRARVRLSNGSLHGGKQMRQHHRVSEMRHQRNRVSGKLKVHRPRAKKKLLEVY